MAKMNWDRVRTENRERHHDVEWNTEDADDISSDIAASFRGREFRDAKLVNAAVATGSGPTNSAWAQEQMFRTWNDALARCRRGHQRRGHANGCAVPPSDKRYRGEIRIG